jgi:uncharacterized protein with PQ loop repeat
MQTYYCSIPQSANVYTTKNLKKIAINIGLMGDLTVYIYISHAVFIVDEKCILIPIYKKLI